VCVCVCVQAFTQIARALLECIAARASSACLKADQFPHSAAYPWLSLLCCLVGVVQSRPVPALRGLLVVVLAVLLGGCRFPRLWVLAVLSLPCFLVGPCFTVLAVLLGGSLLYCPCCAAWWCLAVLSLLCCLVSWCAFDACVLACALLCAKVWLCLPICCMMLVSSAGAVCCMLTGAVC